MPLKVTSASVLPAVAYRPFHASLSPPLPPNERLTGDRVAGVRLSRWLERSSIVFSLLYSDWQALEKLLKQSLSRRKARH